ncbi:MAG: hypothetical protein LBJ47_01605 [Tannerella sp.]|jgi:CxxC motif-containing protein (DUF1111 family)|nr:hypothetical protein [Tannerella sp.]
MRQLYFCFAIIGLLSFASCNGGNDELPDNLDELSEEYYAGGRLGTTFNETTVAYERPSPAVEQGGYIDAFIRGEHLFEDPFVTTGADESPRGGLGPLYLRTSCIHCHPGYGHGRRQTSYNSSTIGNGYLLVVTDETDTYLSSLTGMPQTRAVEPFKAPVDETKIRIDWLAHVDEWGNTFPDGESYSLIYPEVTIPADAYYVPLEVTKNGATTVVPLQDVRVRLESTIGLYGTGLLDAIPDDSIKAEYAKQERLGVSLNPAFFAGGEWTRQYANTLQGNGEQHPFRYTYALSRGPLQDAAGANAIWNITNVTRSDRHYHYMTGTYARVASKDPDVQARFYEIFPRHRLTGNVETDIYNYLMAPTADAPEMSDGQYIDFMVWHRGLAVPAARNLDDEEVRTGRQLFREIGCATCHRPSWTTGDDNFTDPALFFRNGDVRLPRYPNQKIWPYSDMVQHRLSMKNDIRTGWCRTTPLWGRGLSLKCTGASDRLHDCRARTVMEAIMWHGAAGSDARQSIEKFRNLSKAERDAIVEFIDAI